MAERSTIARPYANAAFRYARAGGQQQQWSEMLANCVAIAADGQVRPLLGNPRVPSGSVSTLMAEIAAADVDEGSNFLRLLDDEGRLGLLPEIAELFEQLRQAEENSVDVLIESAQAIGTPQLELIQKSLARRLQCEVAVSVELDESLLGGAVIRMGDQVIDGSVRGRLQQLAATLQR
ncbi:MAG: F0F1 ATP synthase subunit delta [Immundisolibacteraceae bacterium]|nr:F0F1 ATP synthase subunit delta [Immundisolibacteraceae bacterium]